MARPNVDYVEKFENFALFDPLQISSCRSRRIWIFMPDTGDINRCKRLLGKAPFFDVFSVLFWSLFKRRFRLRVVNFYRVLARQNSFLLGHDFCFDVCRNF